MNKITIGLIAGVLLTLTYLGCHEALANDNIHSVIEEVRTPHEHHLINGDVYYIVAREHINNRGADINCTTWSFVVTSENTELAIELPNVREYLAFLQYMSHPAMFDEMTYQHAIQFFMARYAVSDDY